MSLRRWFDRTLAAPALVAALLVPAAVAAVEVASVGTGHAEDEHLDERTRARRDLLRRIPSDPAVLINVTTRDLPSSPELVNLGKRSTQALERCLADNVETDARARCAVVLEALGDRRALPTLQHALDDWESLVRLRVVRALGAMPDKSSVEPLLRLHARKDEEPYVKGQILRTLGSIGDPRVVQYLRKLVGAKLEGDEDVRAQAFDSLWMHRHLMDRNTLVGDVAKALASDNPGLVLSATFAAAELRSPRLAAALVPLMESPNAEIANKAIYALGRIGDKTATKALVARLPDVRDSRMLNNLAFALERLDKKAFYAEIAKTVEHKQAVIRLNSAFVLGDVGHAEGLPMLLAALGDASDFVRTSAVAAIGKLALRGGTLETATNALLPLAGSSNLSLREEAIYALHAITPGGRADLLHDRLYRGLDPRRQGASIRRAALALARAKDPRVHDYLLECAVSYGCDVDLVGPYLNAVPRDADGGRVLLAWSRGQHHLTDLVSQLRPAGGALLASAALRDAWSSPLSSESLQSMRLLGGLHDASAVDLLTQRAGVDLAWPRIVALVAAGRLGAPSVAGRLAAELDDAAAETLPDYARALAIVTEPGFRTALDPLLEERARRGVPELALCAAAVRLAWNPETGFFRFLEALASPSTLERQLAERYLAKNRDTKVTWAMRRALAREEREDVRDRLRSLLDARG